MIKSYSKENVRLKFRTNIIGLDICIVRGWKPPVYSVKICFPEFTYTVTAGNNQITGLSSTCNETAKEIAASACYFVIINKIKF